MAGKKRAKAGPRSLKSEKRKKRKGRESLSIAQPPAQTREPFEQDPKRRIGQHVGTGEAPLMKK
jgi:hypothetical protein